MSETMSETCPRRWVYGHRASTCWVCAEELTTANTLRNAKQAEYDRAIREVVAWLRYRANRNGNTNSRLIERLARRLETGAWKADRLGVAKK